MAAHRILAADGEQHILDLLAYNLERSGYEVATARNGDEVMQSVAEQRPALIILDMLMPAVGGDVVCRRLKDAPATAAIPIIMLSARNEESDMLLALENGADDYMTKPFSVRELMARVRALLRRTDPPLYDKTRLTTDALTINTVTYEVRLYGRPLTLTLKEFELLRTLVEQQNRVLTRDYLMDHIWGYGYYGETRTVDVHIRHLRKKFGDYADSIQTVRGVGYKFVEPDGIRDQAKGNRE